MSKILYKCRVCGGMPSDAGAEYLERKGVRDPSFCCSDACAEKENERGPLYKKPAKCYSHAYEGPLARKFHQEEWTKCVSVVTKVQGAWCGILHFHGERFLCAPTTIDEGEGHFDVFPPVKRRLPFIGKTRSERGDLMALVSAEYKGDCKETADGYIYAASCIRYDQRHIEELRKKQCPDNSKP